MSETIQLPKRDSEGCIEEAKAILEPWVKDIASTVPFSEHDVRLSLREVGVNSVVYGDNGRMKKQMLPDGSVLVTAENTILERRGPHRPWKCRKYPAHGTDIIKKIVRKKNYKVRIDKEKRKVVVYLRFQAQIEQTG